MGSHRLSLLLVLDDDESHIWGVWDLGPKYHGILQSKEVPIEPSASPIKLRLGYEHPNEEIGWDFDCEGTISFLGQKYLKMTFDIQTPPIELVGIQYNFSGKLRWMAASDIATAQEELDQDKDWEELDQMEEEHRSGSDDPKVLGNPWPDNDHQWLEELDGWSERQLAHIEQQNGKRKRLSGV